jgi:hypothetical protein
MIFFAVSSSFFRIFKERKGEKWANWDFGFLGMRDPRFEIGDSEKEKKKKWHCQIVKLPLSNCQTATVKLTLPITLTLPIKLTLPLSIVKLPLPNCHCHCQTVKLPLSNWHCQTATAKLPLPNCQ